MSDPIIAAIKDVGNTALESDKQIIEVMTKVTGLLLGVINRVIALEKDHEVMRKLTVDLAKATAENAEVQSQQLDNYGERIAALENRRYSSTRQSTVQ